MDCIFCKVVKKEIPARIIYEDDTAVAFLDIHPLSLAQGLVIPKNHYEFITDIPSEELGRFFQAVQKTIRKIKDKFSPDGFTLGINHGEAAGRTMDHFHFLIIPRYKGDKGGSVHSVVDSPPKISLDEVYKRFFQ